MARRLTAGAVAKLKAGKGRREIADSACPGLYLVVQPSGVRSWAFRYRRPSGATAKMTLGTADVAGMEGDGSPALGGHLTLAAARALATEQRRQVALGRDPGAAHLAQKKVRKLAAQQAVDDDFPAFARRYVQRHARPSTRRWRFTARTLGLDPDDAALPVIGGSLADRWRGRPAAAISKKDVVAELDRAVDQGRGPTAGNHLLAALRAMYRWHVKRDALAASPCAMIDPPVAAKKLRRSHRLSDDEVRWLGRALDDSPPTYAALVRFLLLTPVRRDEARCMTRGELSADGKTWTIPGARAKNRLDHLVPLSEEARAVLAAAPPIEGKTGYVFTLDGRTPISGMSKWKRQLDERMQALAREERGEGAVVGRWQLHDFRRNARSYLSRVASPDIAERCLGHVVSGVRAHYDVHEYQEEKARALVLWAREVERIIGGKAAKVLPMRKKGA
jgi:integrase